MSATPSADDLVTPAEIERLRKANERFHRVLDCIATHTGSPPASDQHWRNLAKQALSDHASVDHEGKAQIPYKDMLPETDWTLSASHINKLQQASIETLVRRCKQAHFVDIVVRINGRWEVFQADWIKHLETLGPLVQGESFVPATPIGEPRALHASCLGTAEQSAVGEFGPPLIPGYLHGK